MVAKHEIRRVNMHQWVGPNGAEGRLIDISKPVEGMGDMPVKQFHLNIHVPREARRNGIGKAIAKKVLRDLAEHNQKSKKEDRVYRVFARPGHHIAEAGAEEFFEKLGFTCFGDGYYCKHIEHYN